MTIEFGGRTYIEDQVGAIAQDILQDIAASEKGATVLALQGDLGAGKTTLTKAIAKELGVTDTVISPTFVIAKFYSSSQAPQNLQQFEKLIHIDAYRIESNEELGPLGWQALLQQPNTLIIVEWPERIREVLPYDAQYFVISHDGEQRVIKKLL